APGLGRAAGGGAAARGCTARPTGELGDHGVVLDVEAGERLAWWELLGQRLVRFVDALVQRVEGAGRHVDADRRQPLRLEARLAVRRDAHLQLNLDGHHAGGTLDLALDDDAVGRHELNVRLLPGDLAACDLLAQPGEDVGLREDAPLDAGAWLAWSRWRRRAGRRWRVRQAVDGEDRPAAQQQRREQRDDQRAHLLLRGDDALRPRRDRHLRVGQGLDGHGALLVEPVGLRRGLAQDRLGAVQRGTADGRGGADDHLARGEQRLEPAVDRLVHRLVPGRHRELGDRASRVVELLAARQGDLDRLGVGGGEVLAVGQLGEVADPDVA